MHAYSQSLVTNPVFLFNLEVILSMPVVHILYRQELILIFHLNDKTYEMLIITLGTITKQFVGHVCESA